MRWWKRAKRKTAISHRKSRWSTTTIWPRRTGWRSGGGARGRSGRGGGTTREWAANPKAPGHNRIGLGDTEERAWCHYIRTGDHGGLQFGGFPGEQRASNDTTMNITTAGDGGDGGPAGGPPGGIA